MVIQANVQATTPFTLQHGIWMFGPAGTAAYSPNAYHDPIFFIVKRATHNGTIVVETLSYSWFTFNYTLTDERKLQFTTQLSGHVGFRRLL